MPRRQIDNQQPRTRTYVPTQHPNPTLTPTQHPNLTSTQHLNPIFINELTPVINSNPPNSLHSLLQNHDVLYTTYYNVDINLPTLAHRLNAASRIELELIFDTLNIYLTKQTIYTNQFQTQFDTSIIYIQILKDLLLWKPTDKTSTSTAPNHLYGTNPGVFDNSTQPTTARQEEYTI